MYLNVNLTTPPTEGSCTTPKTPEILKTLINLTSPGSNAPYQNQVTSDLLSPVSNVSTPSEEVASTPLGHHANSFRSNKRHSSGSSSDGGGGGLTGGSPTTVVGVGPLVGATPPATPDLPSPVNTVQATRTALIKEGLKHQIKSKLQAAGVGPEELLSETKLVKEELTMEDSERRQRRRERNKIAATKCRNKKREKTMILMNSLFQESEQVEDQNLKLKTEIQRLKNEKLKLEKLLGDPNHQSSCKHSQSYSAVQSPTDTKDTKMPLVFVTPPEASDSTPTTSAVASLHDRSVITNACSAMYGSASSQSPYSEPQPHSSPSSTITQSLTHMSSCNTYTPNNNSDVTVLCKPKISPTLTHSASPNLISTGNSQQISQSLPTLNSDIKISQCSSSDLLHINQPSMSSASEFTVIKRDNSLQISTHHQYQYSNSQHMELMNFGGSSSTGALIQEKSYCSQINNNDMSKYQYNYPKIEPDYSNDYLSPSIHHAKSNYLAPKSRAANMARYHPYNCAGRLDTLPLDSHNNHRVKHIDHQEPYDPSLGCGQQGIEHSFINEQPQGSFYSYL